MNPSRKACSPIPRAYNKLDFQPILLQYKQMLSWVVTFLIIALIAGLLGFTGIAGASVEIAKIIFFIFLILFVVSLIFSLIRR